MAEKKEKLTPAEFLAALKGRKPPTRHVTAPTSETIEDLDFSDLERAPADGNGEPDGSCDADAGHGDSGEPSSDVPSKYVGNYVKRHSRLSELFDRVNTLLGSNSQSDPQQPFQPKAPETLEEAQLSFEDVERLILKYLLAKGSARGRTIASQLRLPFQVIDPLMKQLKQELLVSFKGSAEMGDYDFAITDLGRERGRRYTEECTYFGAAPVALTDYLKAMTAQSIAKQHATEEDLRRAFSDLIINPRILDRLGPAINSGRGMFLFGFPGNGKTSIAERVTRSFGTTIWIPRTLGIDGDIIRLFDPGIHDAVDEVESNDGILNLSGVDRRWVQIVRPTVVAGGELTMQELEVVQNPQTKICEAPLQLKSNCGVLVIDDFGRQTMPVDVLLNRWIVPLEKRFDFLNLPSGKKVQVPFDQLIIFSTNLEPKDLVDEAFLRRIPYKIEVPVPTEDEFRRLCELMAPNLGFEYEKAAVDYLIEKHYKQANRSFRACHPRDLMLQVRNYCLYKGTAKKLSTEAFDVAVENYFSVM